jgi:hypothetical protein
MMMLFALLLLRMNVTKLPCHLATTLGHRKHLYTFALLVHERINTWAVSGNYSTAKE